MSGARLLGIDASSVQGDIPFHRMSLDFIILKAQQGNDGFDPSFRKNLDAALAHGVEAFAYCFIYPLPHLDPKAQAKLFVEKVYAHPEMVGRPIFLDLEWPSPEEWAKWGCTKEQVSKFCEELCEEVENLSGRTPVIYTYPWWWKSIGSPAWAERYPLWLASYTAEPVKLAPWGERWLFWQYDGDGKLFMPNGVDADFNYFNGDKEALARFVAGPNREAPSFDIVHPRVPLPERSEPSEG